VVVQAQVAPKPGDGGATWVRTHTFSFAERPVTDGLRTGIICCMAVLVVPDPSVVVLIGAAGSGKSTLAARLFTAQEVLSSDAFRAMIAGDARDQGATGAAFRAIERGLERRLAAGRLTVIDATNVKRADRRPWLAAAERHGVPAVAIVFDLLRATVIGQDARRSRVVGADVIDRHLAALRRSLAPDALVVEGFATVLVLTSPATAATLAVERGHGRPRVGTDRSGT